MKRTNYCLIMFLRQRSMTQRPGTAKHYAMRILCAYTGWHLIICLLQGAIGEPEKSRETGTPCWWLATETTRSCIVASSYDTAIIVAMHLMHRKEKYKCFGLDIFGLESPWPWNQKLAINYSWAFSELCTCTRNCQTERSYNYYCF